MLLIDFGMSRVRLSYIESGRVVCADLRQKPTHAKPARPLFFLSDPIQIEKREEDTKDEL